MFMMTPSLDQMGARLPPGGGRRLAQPLPLFFHFDEEVGPLEPNSRTSTTCYDFIDELRKIQAFRSEVSRNS
jgi:hypothetical protein